MLGVIATLRRSLAAIAVTTLAACSATGYQISELAAEINATLERSRAIVVGDTITVVFPFKTDWNHDARVGPDGVANFLIVDAVPVAGLSLAELDARLTDLYFKKGQKEEITVDIQAPGEAAGAAAGADSAFVVGEVQRPGPVALAGRTLTLVEAIAAAGGHLKATANLSNTILVRRLASGDMRQWRLDGDIYEWGQHPPIWLQPRDIVFVPNTAIDDVNIWVDQYIRQMIPLPGFIPL
jgi:protein involved in polysaccharide export with SLBB domain